MFLSQNMPIAVMGRTVVLLNRQERFQINSFIAVYFHIICVLALHTTLLSGRKPVKRLSAVAKYLQYQCIFDHKFMWCYIKNSVPDFLA